MINEPNAALNEEKRHQSFKLRKLSTKNDAFFSFPEGIVVSLPVKFHPGSYNIVEDLDVSPNLPEDASAESQATETTKTAKRDWNEFVAVVVADLQSEISLADGMPVKEKVVREKTELDQTAADGNDVTLADETVLIGERTRFRTRVEKILEKFLVSFLNRNFTLLSNFNCAGAENEGTEVHQLATERAATFDNFVEDSNPVPPTVDTARDQPQPPETEEQQEKPQEEKADEPKEAVE